MENKKLTEDLFINVKSKERKMKEIKTIDKR